MNRLRSLVPLALLAAIVWLSAGAGSCSQQPLPQLIAVRELAPSDVELGDRISITGDGFPAGKEARVTFRGDLLRPAERPIHDVEIAVTASVAGPDRIEVPFGEAEQALFCGAGDRAVHTTFEGEVEVAFAAASPGAPPIAGVLRGVTLDVRPGAAQRDDDLDRQGQRVLDLAGLRSSAPARRGVGLTVDQVVAGSRAQAAGIAPGDILATFDGVRVDSAGDLVPAPQEREAVVGVRRADSAAVTPRVLSVEGFRRPLAAELFASTLLVLGMLAVTLLFGTPAPPSIASALHRIGSRLRARADEVRGAAGSPVRRLIASAVRDVLPPAGAPGIVDVATCALLAAMPFGQYLVAARLDVGLLFAAGLAGVTAAAFAANGTLWAAARSAAHVAWQHLPAAVAVASVVVTTGSLRVQEIERAQGGWPWDWLAFRSPAALVALLLLLGSARIEPEAAEPPQGLAALVEPPPAARAAARGRWLDAACRAHQIIVAALASALFLGGWALPGLSPFQQDARPVLELAGAALWLGKTALLVLVLSCARWGAPWGRLAERTRATAAWRVPLSLAALAATAAWTRWSPGQAAQRLVSGGLVMLAAFVAIAIAQRLRLGLTAAGTDGHLSGFI